MSTDDEMTPTDAMSTADAIPAPDATPVLDTTPTVEASAEPMAPPAAPLAPIAAAPSRKGLASAALGARLLRFAFAIVLLVAGAYSGYQLYLDHRPAPEIPGDPAVVGTSTPPAVAELAAAIGSDDANAIRVALSADMFSSYAADMERFGITRVQSVETLGTFDDGDRTATALVILGQTVDGSPFTINLVVIAQGGQIVRLR